MRPRRVLALALLGSLAAVAALASRGRARHLALPVLRDPSLPTPPPAPLGEGPSCATQEVARVGARITALLVASDGALWIGTFDAGVRVLRPEPPAPGAPGSGSFAERAASPLAGRERFVNALAEHDGLVWVATQGGLVAFDDERRVLALLPRDGVTALARAGPALLAGSARGLFRISVEDGAWPIEARGPSGEPLRVSALAESGGRLWIGTPSGAYSLPVGTLDAPLLDRTARWHPLVFGEPPAETNVVTALAPLGDGVVAGTDDGGLVRLRPDGGVAAARFAEPRANEVSPGAAATSAAGALLGTQGAGVLLARPRAGGLEVVRPRGAAALSVSAIAGLAGGFLLGTPEGVVLRLACAPWIAGLAPPARDGA